MKRLIPVVAVLLLAGAACDDDVSSACEAQQTLESSVDDLRNIDVVDDGVDALRTDVDAVATSALAPCLVLVNNSTPQR